MKTVYKLLNLNFIWKMTGIDLNFHRSGGVWLTCEFLMSVSYVASDETQQVKEVLENDSRC
jgi:hypothetical protein